MKTGRIIQISGPVVDVAFEDGILPKIKEALYVEVDGEKRMMETCLHLGNKEVRCIMLGASEGLARDMAVISTGSSIKVPVGDCTIGRMFNVVGEPIDRKEPIPEDNERWEIHRKAPSFADQSVETEMLETGLKDRSFRRCRCR